MSDYLLQAQKEDIYHKVDLLEDEMIEEIAKLVAIPSLPTYVTEEGMNHGPEIKRCLHAALALSETLGFRTHNEDDNYGWAEIGDEGPLVCIFLHLDVVPAGEGWTKEPFKLSREGDFLYGRGVLDDKAPAVSILYALKTCCDMGVRWPCRIRVWFGTNEETGKVDVQMYIRKYGVPDYSFVPDSQFPLSYSELSSINFDLYKRFSPKDVDSKLKLLRFEANKTPNGIPPHSKAVLRCDDQRMLAETAKQLESFAKENHYQMRSELQDDTISLYADGHVSERWNEPWTGINSLARLVLFLDTLQLGGETDELIHFVATKVGNETDGGSLGISYHSETADLSVALRNVSYDDHGLSFNLFVLFPADHRNEYVFATLQNQVKTHGFEIIMNSMNPGFIRDRNDPFLNDLYRSYCEVTGNDDPIKVCGGTYAKYIPGSIPFGVIFGPEQDICHAPDEHIRVSSELMVWTKIYVNALLRIADHIGEYHNT